MIIGDGMGVQITHTGKYSLSTSSKSFLLNDVLCAPKMHQNLISVCQFCKINHTSIEFDHTSFCIKDLTMEAPLARGQSRNIVYEWSSIRETQLVDKKACVGIKTTLDRWHDRLGHPS